MIEVDELDSYTTQDEQLWYVAHPIHPTEEEVAVWMKRLTPPIPSMVGMAPDLDPARLAILGNIVNAKGWLAWLIWRYPAVTFIAPYVATLDGGGDDDLDPAQRARGLRDCRRTVRVCNGIVLVGGRLSAGMIDEASVARAAIDLTSLGRTPPPRLDRKELL